MFCIAAFIVFVILGIFSARYRTLARDAWKCVSRKVTFRKCDTSFKEDLKSQLLARVIIKRPRLARVLDKWIDVLAFVFVILSIWSLLVVVKAGLNLYVYGTCNPDNASSCSIGAEACSVNTGRESFWKLLKDGKPHSWVATEVSNFGETLTRVPDRMKEWKPAEYTNPSSSYYRPFDPAKPTALEVIDPGCIYCAQLFANIKKADADDRYNLTYVGYPIPDATQSSGYRFRYSKKIVAYLEAVKREPLTASPAADWQILERIFTGVDEKGVSYQIKINGIYTDQQVDEQIAVWLKEIGYSDEQIAKIAADAQSDAVKDIMAEQKELVEDQIKTVKIPTMLINGRRYDGVVGPEKLR